MFMRSQFWKVKDCSKAIEERKKEKEKKKMNKQTNKQTNKKTPENIEVAISGRVRTVSF